MSLYSALSEVDDTWLLLAVANTGHLESDELADPATAASWWRQLDGAPAWSGDAGDDVAALRAARTVIRARTLANNGAEADDSAAVALLEALPLHLDLGSRPGVQPDGAAPLPAALAARAALALIRASAGQHWHRVKACPGPDCAWVFVDASRNCSRRWCDMSQCGNRAKGQSFRARQSA